MAVRHRFQDSDLDGILEAADRQRRPTKAARETPKASSSQPQKDLILCAAALLSPEMVSGGSPEFAFSNPSTAKSKWRFSRLYSRIEPWVLQNLKSLRALCRSHFKIAPCQRLPKYKFSAVPACATPRQTHHAANIDVSPSTKPVSLRALSCAGRVLSRQASVLDSKLLTGMRRKVVQTPPSDYVANTFRNKANKPWTCATKSQDQGFLRPQNRLNSAALGRRTLPLQLFRQPYQTSSAPQQKLSNCKTSRSSQSLYHLRRWREHRERCGPFERDMVEFAAISSYLLICSTVNSCNRELAKGRSELVTESLPRMRRAGRMGRDRLRLQRTAAH